MEILFSFLGAILVLCLLVGYSVLSWGLVLYKFYYWFLLPVFIDLPHIDFWQAVGLSIFTTLLKNHNVETVKDEYLEKSKGYMIYINPWVVLFIGWMFHLFIK